MATSTTSSFWFYDPDSLHTASQFDRKIVHIRDREELLGSIAANKRLRQVVCICSRDKSTLAEEILKHEHIVSIYLCNDNTHGINGMNSSSYTKIHSIIFTQDNGWEFKGRLALLEACIKCRHTDQVLDELQRLRRIQERSQDLPPLAAEAIEHTL